MNLMQAVPDVPLPNLAIVGVAKAGTSSLFHYLSQHPEICASDVKELRYFSPLQYGERLAPIETYAKHFSHCTMQRYRMEATPGYFYGGPALARGLHSTCPSVRAIIILRSPDQRCWSFYQFVKSRVRIPQDLTFSSYLDRCEELHAQGTDMDRENGDYSGLAKGCYARWLDDWTGQYGDDLRVVFFEDMVDDPRSFVKSILDWLELDVEAADGFSFAVDNRTVQSRHLLLQRGMVEVSRRSQRLFHRHRAVKRLLRRAYYSVNGVPPGQGMTPSERERLRAFYRPHNLDLAGQLDLLGMKLPAGWDLEAGPTLS
jgi:Sulfotransferase domain